MKGSLKFAAVLGLTVVFSAIGVLLLVAGVHGPQIMSWLGAFLLLPVIVLKQVGLHVPIPLLDSANFFSLLLFIGLQMGYYYLLVSLLSLLFSRPRRRVSA